MADAQQQYAAIEEQLRLLGRNLDAMHGGLQELDALIEQAEKRIPQCVPSPDVPPEAQ
jgi:hypothetical protein